jgi:beta-glucosidase
MSTSTSAFAPVSTIESARPTAGLSTTDSAPVDPVAAHRADLALAKLTLEEKVALLAGNSTMSIAAQPKIGLNDEFWFSDGPHTVRPELDRHTFNSANRTDDVATVLPTLSALATTWDVDLARRFGELLGREARDRGKDVLLGPGVNLMRTPLNGRNYEYLGEDPVLAGRLATAYVHGVQSQNIAACVKHYAGNEQEWERGTVDVLMDERTLRELYLAPFEAAVKDGGALTLMNGYNRFRGEFCSHNDYLNNQVLKREWGFPGLVVSDWSGLHDTVAGALGGLDVEMNAGDAIRFYKQPLIDAVRDGRVPESVVDDHARRVLYVMAKIGKLGDFPRAPGVRGTVEHYAFAREVAEQAIVLLKNDDAILPLDRAGIRRLLVIGSNATARHTGGGWSAEGKPPYETTPLEGLQKLLGEHVAIEHIAGPFAECYEPVPELVIQTIDTSDLAQGAAVRGWWAEYFASSDFSAASTARGFERRPGLAARGVARWTTEIVAPETGDYRLSATHDGRVRVQVDGAIVLEMDAGGTVRRSEGAVRLEKGRSHVVVVEYTPKSDETRLEFGWRLPSREPIALGTLAERVRAADGVVFFTGNRLGHGRAQEGEGADRPHLSLPEGENEAIMAVLAVRPDAVIVNQSGSPVEMPWVEWAPTLVQYWFCGMDGGMRAGTRALWRGQPVRTAALHFSPEPGRFAGPRVGQLRPGAGGVCGRHLHRIPLG